LKIETHVLRRCGRFLEALAKGDGFQDLLLSADGDLHSVYNLKLLANTQFDYSV
jgi:hypothetical protein